ncbi:MAG: rhodanese-like domain-containing protein [Salinarimonas sp.]
MTTHVTDTPPAPSAEAEAHFARRLALETDCDDVHVDMSSGQPGFVLVDVRGPNAYARAHVPGAINIPHREITAERLAFASADTLFVVYCEGPHCNGADKGALRLARLGRPVKIMIGGMLGWREDHFPFWHGTAPGSVEEAEAKAKRASPPAA